MPGQYLKLSHNLFFLPSFNAMSCDSSGGVVIVPQVTNNLGFHSGWSREFYLLHCSQTSCGTYLASCAILYQLQSEGRTEHLLASSAKFKNGWSSVSTCSVHLHGVACRFKNRTNGTVMWHSVDGLWSQSCITGQNCVAVHVVTCWHLTVLSFTCTVTGHTDCLPLDASQSVWQSVLMSGALLALYCTVVQN